MKNIELLSPAGSMEAVQAAVNFGADAIYMGGSQLQSELREPVGLTAPIPLTDTDDTSTAEDETQASAEGAAEGVTSVTGDVREGTDDGVYDYTESGILRRAKLGVRTLDVTFSVGVTSVTKHMQYVSSDATPTADNDLMVVPALTLPQSPEEVPDIAPGYDMVYLGSDILSHYWAAFAWDLDGPYAGWAAEVPFYTDDQVSLYVGSAKANFVGRNLMLPTMRLKHATVTEGGPFQARYSSVQMYTFSDENGRIMNTYCADQFTSPVDGYSYRCVNLEDSDYYTKNEAYMLRTVMNNGYWGSESGWGSLDAVKQLMRDSGQFTEAEVNSLTDGMALTATQYTIWNFANFNDNAQYIGVYYFADRNHRSATGVVDEAIASVVMRLYHYLISLEPTMPTATMRSTTQSTIINEKNFLDDASVTITGKPETHPNNQDDDDTNDVYTADVSFTLSVTPSEERGDNLVMHLTGINSETIIGRIVGPLQDGEIDLEHEADDENTYIFRGLELQEGEHELGFFMGGYQILDKTPHLLISEKRSADDEGSQSMVGLCYGKRGVGVSMDFVFEVDVDDPLYFTRRVWRIEVPRINPPTGVDTLPSRRKELVVKTEADAENI
ncbi:MAG: Cys-Gln thioester bond-forming surface protein [Oscillospiraceae bacterium]|nr:Cys-Gln thioester bond-forming surface protein [Oscillospiraceae bacterium]